MTLVPGTDSRNTRSLSGRHAQWLAGCCLPNANSGLLARIPAMQFGRIGCTLGRPRRGWPCGVSYVVCCGAHGPDRSSSHLQHLHSQRVPRASQQVCRCLECAPSATNSCLRVSEPSPNTRRWQHCACVISPRPSGPGWDIDGSSTSTISGAGKRHTRWCGMLRRLTSPLPPKPAPARKSHAAEGSRDVLAVLITWKPGERKYRIRRDAHTCAIW